MNTAKAPRGRPKAQKATVQLAPDLIAPKPLDSPAKPPAKKAKKQTYSAWSKTKGRKGAMEAFKSLPLDLIYEICCNLEPADLFALSTTSKIFRAVVTGPSSKPLWIGAREKLGLPELELPMTDLQYAQLLFGKGCSFCDRKNAGKPEPFIRARICGACSKAHFANTSTQSGAVAVMKATDAKLHPLTFSCCKPTSPGRHGPSYYLPELARVNAWLYEQDFDMADQWRNLDFVHFRRHPEPNQPEQAPRTAFQKWYAETDEPRAARLTDGEAISAWLRSTDGKKAASKDEIRKARFDEIRSRFHEQGFQASETDVWEFKNDTIVRKPDVVTFRTWPRLEETLKPKLFDIRRRHRKAAFTTEYYNFKRDHSDNKSFPPANVFYQLPTIKALIDDVSVYIIPRTLWEQNLEAIARDVKALLRERREAMVRAVAAAHSALQSAQVEEEAGKHVECSVKGLRFTSITLPRLPPFLPRNSTAPIVASDEQIATFLESSPLAAFECALCGCGGDGVSILAHCGETYGCHSGGEGGQPIDSWARIDASEGHNSIKCDRDVLLVSLKLKQLISQTPLNYHEEEMEQVAKSLSEEWQMPQKKYAVTLKCDCDPLSAYLNRAHITRNVSEMYDHIRRSHTGFDARPVQLTANCRYSPAFRSAILQQGVFAPSRYSREEDIYAALRFEARMAYAGYLEDEENWYDDMTDEDSEVEDARDCVIM
ncbi:hypothetical protein JCM11251_001186 [Rhodosporidiobolus azoricus]